MKSRNRRWSRRWGTVAAVVAAGAMLAGGPVSASAGPYGGEPTPGSEGLGDPAFPTYGNGGDRVDVRAEHDIVVDVDPAEVVEPAVLVHEDVSAYAYVDAVIGVDRRNEVERLVHRLAGELAPTLSDRVLLGIGESVDLLGEPNRPLHLVQADPIRRYSN